MVNCYLCVHLYLISLDPANSSRVNVSMSSPTLIRRYQVPSGDAIPAEGRLEVVKCSSHTNGWHLVAPSR